MGSRREAKMPFGIASADFETVRLLEHFRAMEAQGFSVYPEEWWHFDFADWGQYPINNVSFEQLRKRRKK